MEEAFCHSPGDGKAREQSQDEGAANRVPRLQNVRWCFLLGAPPPLPPQVTGIWELLRRVAPSSVSLASMSRA